MLPCVPVIFENIKATIILIVSEKLISCLFKNRIRPKFEWILPIVSMLEMFLVLKPLRQDVWLNEIWRCIL